MQSLCLLALLTSTLSETATRTLTLAEAVDLAIAADPELARAELAHDRADLAALRAELDRFSFRVDAQLQELWTRANIGGDRADGMDGGLGLSNLSASLTIPLFAGFRVESAVDRAGRLAEAAKQDALEQRRATAIAVARAYWTVRKIALLRDVDLQALDRIESAEQIARARRLAGLAPPIDEGRARARRLRQEAVVADLDGASREASARLAVLLGLEQEVTLVDSPRAPAALSVSLDAVLDAARDRRPALQAARARADAQREAVDIAESSYYPTLDVFSLFQYGNNPFLAGAGSRAVFGTANPFEGMAGDFQIGAVLSINLFDTLSTYTAVKDARLEEERLWRESEQVRRGADAEVRTAYARVGRFSRLQARLRAAEAVARDNVEINKRRYESGEAQVFELLDSEIELLELERQLADSQAELTLAWLDLEAASGQLVGGPE